MAKTEVIHIRIDPETLKALKAAAKTSDRTMSWLALSYIKKGLKK